MQPGQKRPWVRVSLAALTLLIVCGLAYATLSSSRQNLHFDWIDHWDQLLTEASDGQELTFSSGLSSQNVTGAPRDQIEFSFRPPLHSYAVHVVRGVTFEAGKFDNAKNRTRDVLKQQLIKDGAVIEYSQESPFVLALCYSMGSDVQAVVTVSWNPSCNPVLTLHGNQTGRESATLTINHISTRR